MASRIYRRVRTLPASSLGPPRRHPWFSFEMPPRPIQPPQNLKAKELAGFFRDERVPLLPYTPQETYNRAESVGQMPTIVLENDCLRATIYPQYGARLASLYDKKAERELLFDNPVFQLANLAIRNAWFSGGVEWNCPIYGHNLLTCSPVYVARIATDTGDILRIYEFERSLETAWQVDLCLDEARPALWIHVKVFNLNDGPVDYYWWTNIAVPQTSGTRVIANDQGRCVHHLADQRVFGVDFPNMDGFDGSYPARYKRADSVYLDMHDNQMPWLACVDETGRGIFHASTSQLCGRKMFVWGANTGGRRWADFLSVPGRGAYVELQGGLRPTQLQTIPVPPGIGAEWTECIGSLELDPAQSHHPQYPQAQAAVRRWLADANTERLVVARHEILCAAATQPVTENLWRGSAWGALYEKATGRRIAGSMTFDASPSEGEKPWAQIIDGKGFDVGQAVGDWVCKPRWIDLIRGEIDAGRGGWKHYLHLGVYLLEQHELESARKALVKSNELRDNEYAWRNLALLAVREGDITRARAAYLRALDVAGPQIELALEYSRLLFDHHVGGDYRGQAAEAFIQTLPPDIAKHERLQILLGQIALARGDIATVDRILQGNFATIRENETTLSDLWYAVRFHEQAVRLGRALTEEEKRQYRLAHDPPARIDFRMSLEKESAAAAAGRQ